MQRTALALLGLAIACRGGGPVVTLHSVDGREVAVEVEVADTPEERSVGLMYRAELAPDRGMLFVFDGDADHAFWMKNTPLRLDMIFISREGRVVGIVADTTPFSTESRRVGAPSRIVLEVNAGFAAKHGIAAGNRVTVRGISPPDSPDRSG